MSDTERAGRQSDDVYPWAPAGYDAVPSMVALAEDVRALNAAGRELDGRTHDEYPAVNR
jgi:hypothetical protein